MTSNAAPHWKAILGLVSELKRCDECGIATASIAMTYILIDTLANLARAINKSKVTRADFIDWVNEYLKAHPEQPYKYRGKDVYAARCAFLHAYASEAELHQQDQDTIKFAYHDGGKHQYNPGVDARLAIIGVKSLVNDAVHAVESFMKRCQSDIALRERVESRLSSVLQTLPYLSQ